MHLAENLRILRKKHQLTQAQMAVLLEVDRSAYSCYETGKTRPDYEKLVALADYFGVTTDYLLGRSDQRG